MAVSPAEIFEFIVAQGQPGKLPGIWGRVPCSDMFFQLAEQEASLLAILRSRFADEDMLEAGVLVKTSASEHVLNPHLSAPNALICALRESAEGPRSICGPTVTASAGDIGPFVCFSAISGQCHF